MRGVRGVNVVALVATLGFAAFGGLAVPARAQAPTTGVTAFEGARLIVGDGRMIENGTLIVETARGSSMPAPLPMCAYPPGAARVNLAGKTVMPMLIDTHTHLSQTREGLTADLTRRAYYGVSAAQSMGTAETDAELQLQHQIIPGQAQLFTAWRGITRPEPGRGTGPYWITTEEEGRKAVQELAAKKVDIVKIWVDDRDGKFPKLTPAHYGAIIDEAHKNGLRATAHIFTLEDAKGVLRADIDAFAHSVRDRDIDDEFMALVQAAPEPRRQSEPARPRREDRCRVAEVRAFRAAEMAKVEEANTDRPKAQDFYGIQARNIARLNAAGVRIVLGTDGNTPWAPHVEMADMVAAGMTPMQVIVAATRNAAAFLRMGDARYAGGRQERRLHRARRQPARRHHQHAENLSRVPARCGGGPLPAAPLSGA